MFSCMSWIRRISLVSSSAVLALTFGGVAEVRADYITSNLTASQGFNTTAGYNLTGPSSVNGQGFSVGVRFTMGASTTDIFTSAQLALAYRSGTNSLKVELMTNSGSVPSGVILETINVTGISGTPGLVNVSSALHPVLTAGSTYWLVAVYGGSDTNISWMYNSTGGTGNTAYRSDTATTTGAWMYYSSLTDPAFSISGTPVVATGTNAVDTPSSALLVGIGSLALITGRWFQRKRAGQLATSPAVASV